MSIQNNIKKRPETTTVVKERKSGYKSPARPSKIGFRQVKEEMRQLYTSLAEKEKLNQSA